MWTKIKLILGSPRFWALLIALVLFVINGFKVIALDETALTSATVALVAFIISVSATGTPTIWVELLKSLRFWALLVSLAFVFVRSFWPTFPLTEDQILGIITALSGASIGISYRPINDVPKLLPPG
jgi:hypothetical protein